MPAREGNQARVQAGEVGFASPSDPGRGTRHVVRRGSEPRRLQVQVQVLAAVRAAQLQLLIAQAVELALPDPKVLEGRQGLQ